LDAAEDNDFETILDYMERLEEAISEGQIVSLTDSRLTELLESARSDIREGDFTSAATAADEIAESLTNEVNARRE